MGPPETPSGFGSKAAAGAGERWVRGVQNRSFGLVVTMLDVGHGLMTGGYRTLRIFCRLRVKTEKGHAI